MSTQIQQSRGVVRSTPPALPGLPLLGHALEFRRDPSRLFRDGYRQLGPIFSIRLGPQHAAVLLGPEANRFFFTETDRFLSMREVYRFLIPMFGDDFVFLAPEEEYHEQRAILLPAFSAHNVDGYVSAMVREVDDWLDTLGESGAFELTEAIGTLTMLIGTHAFLGENFRSRAGAEFWSLFRDLAGGIEFILPTSLPLPRFIRRDRAKVQLHHMVGEIIAERRASDRQHDDFLQTLLDARYSNGQPLPDRLLIALILGFMFAGHETTQGHACWTLVQLLQHPAYLRRVIDEQTGLLGEAAAPTAASARQMRLLERAIKETERMLPSVRVIMRLTVRPYELHGYRVPRGWLTIASPDVSHRLPEVFTEPDTYDPDRFSPDRAEDRAVPFSLIAFGGGIHRCIGMHFAYTEMKVLFSMLLRRYELELVDPDPRPLEGPAPSRPQAPCTVRYRRRRAGSQP